MQNGFLALQKKNRSVSQETCVHTCWKINEQINKHNSQRADRPSPPKIWRCFREAQRKKTTGGQWMEKRDKLNLYLSKINNNKREILWSKPSKPSLSEVGVNVQFVYWTVNYGLLSCVSTEQIHLKSECGCVVRRCWMSSTRCYGWISLFRQSELQD